MFAAEIHTEDPALVLPLERLEAEICEQAADIWAATSRWLALVAEFDRREGWATWGCKSCAHWLSWRCGVALNAAREKVRVARKLEELPSVSEAFSRGELSYSKVRALTRVATSKNEAELADLARTATTAQLERLVRAYRGVLAADEIERANQRHDRRYVRWSWDDDGSLVIRGRLSPEDGAVFVAAMGAAAQSLSASEGSEDVSAETSSATVRNADALVGMAAAALAADAADATGGDRSQVVVHVDAKVLEQGGSGRCELEDGPSLAAETARRLACDAGVVPIIEDGDGEPLNVGRKTRSVPPAIRRALKSRDGGCRFPGCSQRRFVDGHHVRHWAQGGETSLSNLVLLCRRHHRMVHEGGFGVHAEGHGRVFFTRPDGKGIPDSPSAVKSHCDVRGVNRRRGLNIGPSTCVPRWAGERMDYGLAVDGLLGLDFPPV
ncbi:MAG TPA: DUF222 domain-containing protein [Acidimicrobiales bacterium]|nr:DUF222 domain-containing protein [Acidimicrobiales bacterium]